MTPAEIRAIGEHCMCHPCPDLVMSTLIESAGIVLGRYYLVLGGLPEQRGTASVFFYTAITFNPLTMTPRLAVVHRSPYAVSVGIAFDVEPVPIDLILRADPDEIRPLLRPASTVSPERWEYFQRMAAQFEVAP